MPKTPKPEPTASDAVTTTVAFDRLTYKKLKLLAVERDSNVRELIRTAVDEYLKQSGRKAP